jgi:hypothetical protein
MDPGSAAHRFALRSIRGMQTNRRPGVIPAFFLFRHCERSETIQLIAATKKAGLLRRGAPRKKLGLGKAAATIKTVVARLDRTIQYAAASRFNR